jgi:WD40 repeat protein
MCSLAVLMVCLLAMPAGATPRAAPASAPAAPGDEYWAAGFNLPGLNDTVQALVVGPDGALYAGGMFTTAGGVVANRIARWDGTQWHSLGSGMTGGYYAGVKALVFGHDGSLYVGGEFSTAGGVTANNIARWDGAQWHPLGSGMSGGYNPYVSALAVGLDGSLYAGGAFTTAGGVTTNNIARWDAGTSSWHPLGSGMDIYGAVYALAFGPDGSLYAGGRFYTAGGAAANYIARWDGAQWHPLGNGASDEVNALAVGPDGSLYAGGDFTTAGGVAANRIARWDGATSSWHPLGSGMGGDYPWVSTLAFSPDGSLYAGGSFTTAGGVSANRIARWDAGNSSWYPLGSGVAGRDVFPWVGTLAFGPDGSLYAGGDFTAAGGVAANNIARWDAGTSSWHPLGSGSGLNSVVRALAFGPDGSLYAGGSFTTAGGTAANGIARWDAATSSWHPLGSGMAGVGNYPWGNDHPYVGALAFGPDGSLYAGGHFDTAGGVAANYIARWDAATSSWHPLGSGMGGGYYTIVSALAIGPDGSLYAGGNFGTAGGVAANNIARWDGSQWHPLGGGMTGGYNPWVSALAFGPDGSLYAGGRFDTAGGVVAHYIARWDGTHWHPLGSGMSDGIDTIVYDLAFGPDGSLYAGGNFGTAGGVAANNIARWDGSQWHPLGGGMTGGYNPWVSALAFGPDGSLYAGGRFTTTGGVAANSIARWGAATSSWHPLGSGMGGSDLCVYILAMGSDGSLYAGGSFTTAGGKLSSHIALWTGAILRPAIWFPVVLLEQ